MNINGTSISRLFILLSNINNTSIEQFKNCLCTIKHELTMEEFNLLIYGDKEAIVNTNYKVISKMNNKWSIDSYLRYIVKHKHYLSYNNYTDIAKLYNYIN